MISREKDRITFTSWKAIINSVKILSMEMNVSKSEIITHAIYLWIYIYLEKLQKKEYKDIKEDMDNIKTILTDRYGKVKIEKE